MLAYPYFAEWYFYGEPAKAGLFLGTAIHETSQVAAAGLIYDQQFNSPETLNVATVTKLIRNKFLVIMVPLFGFLYNRSKVKDKNYSLLNIFPYFVLGFIGMIIFRNIGDQLFLTESSQQIWQNIVLNIKDSAKVFLSMAMAAVGLSTNLKDLKSMGYKPFVVGLIAMLTVGLVSIISIKLFTELFL
jgi:uncharacterized membrane protein YadS